MKPWLLGACILYFSLPVALSLTCYHCSSLKSWDKCKSTSTSYTCPVGLDRCAKVYLKFGEIETFAKYCTSSVGCSEDGNPTCKGKVGAFACDISCCRGDDCNAGSAFHASSILLLACALVSLMMFVKA